MKKRYLSFSLIAVGLTILCSLGLIGLAKYVDSGYFKSANNVYRNDGVEIPAHDKTLKQNDDGTYELSLSVEGAIQPKKATANANILVIYDVSGSMSTTLSSYLYVKNDTGRYGLVDGNYVDLYYRNGNSYSAVGNNTISATTTVYTRSWQNNQWTYTEYKNDRYVRTNQRGPATEKVVYDFAKELYKYNETEESTNVEMALVTFSGSRNNGTSTNINAATIEQGWTNKESVFLGHLSNTGTSTKLTYGGGTNWEAAMQRALEVLGDADNDPTYVIFVTDGGPTYRINGGNGSDVDAANYIAARDDALLIRNYNTQTHTSDAETSNTSFYGIYAYGTEADYLDDLVYFVHNNGVERTAGTGTNTNGITGYYFKAEEQHELEAAIAQILEGIVQAIGVTEVSIVDGTTSEVSLTSGEIMHLLHIDESSFTYWMSKEVQEYEGTEDYDYYTDRIDRNNGEVFYVYIKDLGNNQLKCEWVRPSDNVNHSVTVTGYVEDGTATIQWKAGDSSSELFFNQEPPKAKVVNSAVEWDLSSVGTLLNGVTYTVKFDVWNTQTVFDLIADLENGVIQYSELAADANSDYAGLEDYIIQTCGSSGCSYRLATNTDAKLYYKDTRYSDELQEQSYEPPRGIDIVSETINIHKEWKNYYDDKEIPNSIDVALEEDGANYYSTTIRKSSGWSNEREIYISPGLMRIEYGIDPVTNKQIATSFEVLEPGHDYRFSELGSDLYNWQLVSETVHPMVINGVLTELVKIDSDMTTAFSLDDLPMDDYYIPSEMVSDPTLMYMTSDRGNHFVRLVSGGDVYLVNAGTDPTMEAYNYRRSNLNISKTVNGESADPDATFELTIVINDTGLSDGESLWFSVMDQNSNYVDLNERLTSSGWTKSASSSGSIYYYGDNNTTLKVLLKAGENLRFTNLTTEANFTITESNLTEHYVYDSISYTGTYGKSQVAIEDDKLNYSVNDSTKTITGKVNLTNAEFYVNVNNIYELINIEV